MEGLEHGPVWRACEEFRLARAGLHRVRWRWLLQVPSVGKRSLLKLLEHDSLNLSQAAAYSAIVALFPALIVAAAASSLLPQAIPLRHEIGRFFSQVLPSGVAPLLSTYFDVSPAGIHTKRTLGVALFVSLTGASSVIATLMEGLRRAIGLQDDGWTFLRRRGRALLLVFLCLLPLLGATVLVIFGELIVHHLGSLFRPGMRPYMVALALGIRWVIALAGVAGVTSLIYHMGTPRGMKSRERRAWVHTLPGASMAMLLWLAVTLLFGLYVRRFANYSVVYGSLGAGIALLFWLFLVFLSVLCGAEFNAQFFLAKDQLEGRPPGNRTPAS